MWNGHCLLRLRRATRRVSDHECHAAVLRPFQTSVQAAAMRSQLERALTLLRHGGTGSILYNVSRLPKSYAQITGALNQHRIVRHPDFSLRPKGPCQPRWYCGERLRDVSWLSHTCSLTPTPTPRVGSAGVSVRSGVAAESVLSQSQSCLPLPQPPLARP